MYCLLDDIYEKHFLSLDVFLCMQYFIEFYLISLKTWVARNSDFVSKNITLLEKKIQSQKSPDQVLYKKT